MFGLGDLNQSKTLDRYWPNIDASKHSKVHFSKDNPSVEVESSELYFKKHGAYIYLNILLKIYTEIFYWINHIATGDTFH